MWSGNLRNLDTLDPLLEEEVESEPDMERIVSSIIDNASASPPPTVLPAQSLIETTTLDRKAFVQKLNALCLDRKYVAVTSSALEDIVGFLEVDNEHSTLYVTTQSCVYDISIVYVQKVRYAEDGGGLNVVLNADSLVPWTHTISLYPDEFVGVLPNMLRRVVTVNLINKVQAFGLLDQEGEDEYVVHETEQKRHVFSVRALQSISYQSEKNKILCFERVDETDD